MALNSVVTLAVLMLHVLHEAQQLVFGVNHQAAQQIRLVVLLILFAVHVPVELLTTAFHSHLVEVLLLVRHAKCLF